MQVEWVITVPGVNGTGAITHYTIYVDGVGENTNGPVSSYVITGLDSFQVVSVRVSAHTAAGEGSMSQEVTARTNEARRFLLY